MRLSGLQVVLAAALAIVAGGLGAIAAVHWHDGTAQGSLHEFVHDELDLNAAQTASLDALEADFTLEREQLELELKSANARLAAAIEDEHSYGPDVSAAIEQVHARMGELQKATVRHVFAMRALLDARQQQIFDRQVSQSLTGNARD